MMSNQPDASFSSNINTHTHQQMNMTIEAASANATKDATATKKESFSSSSYSSGTSTTTATTTKKKKPLSSSTTTTTTTMTTKNSRNSKILVSKLLLLLSLISAAAICASIAYVSLSKTELIAFEKTYESIASSALDNAKAITIRKLQGSQVMATLLSHTFPNSDQWPLISMDGYVPIANTVAQLSSSTSQSLTVIINPNQVNGFESHAKQVYIDQNRPVGAGYSDFGFGIWKPDKNSTYDDGRSHDTTGETSWDTSPRNGNNIMAPLLMHNIPNASALMYNLYSQSNRGTHINSIMDCVDETAVSRSNNNEGGFNGEDANDEFPSPSCAAITDVLELKVRPGPAALLFQPIFPANTPTEFVGFATTSIHWSEVLLSVVPTFVNGLTCVINTDTTTVTYEIQNGVPQWVGDGDQHDPTYTKFARSEILTSIETGSKSSAVYTLTVYPTEDMVQVFATSNPWKVAIGFLGAIACCTLFFLLYDFNMRSQASERAMVLEMKRRFVRFVSHEIRTPLNTVCMGLELLESETKVAAGSDSSGGSNVIDACNRRRPSMVAEEVYNDDDQDEDEEPIIAPEPVDQDDVNFWHKVVMDMKENAQIAVSTLNDLLNYDKLETGTLKLELGTLNVWDLIDKTVNQFQIQAINRKIDLKLTIIKQDSPPPPSSDGHNDDDDQDSIALSSSDHHDVEAPLPQSSYFDALSVVGDDIRLSQVFRNVISNALKFTPHDGTIEVTVYHSKDGLAKAPPILSENGTDPWCKHPRSGSVVIIIKDSGVGLDQEQLSHLFGEGVQFDANKLQHGGGSGLGLSIAKGIVEHHHGTIRAESDGPGHGTTFVIELPLYQIPPPAFDDDSKSKPNYESDQQSLNATSVTLSCYEKMVPPESSPKKEKQQKQVQQKESLSRRILVAEDSESSRKMLIRLLQRSGHTCIAAANGKETVEAVAADIKASKKSVDHIPIDTILMDYEMPLLDGPEATTEIRQMGYEGNIVGVTGNVLEEDIDFFKHHGADEVCPKPISMDSLSKYWNDCGGRI